MGQGSSELKHEVETARAALARDVDQLADKASPHRIAGRGADRARSGLNRAGRWVSGAFSSLRRNRSTGPDAKRG